MKQTKKEVITFWNNKWEQHLMENKFISLMEEELFTEFFNRFSITSINLSFVSGQDEIFIYLSSDSGGILEEAVMYMNKDADIYYVKINGDNYKEFHTGTPIYNMIANFPWRVMKKDLEKVK